MIDPQILERLHSRILKKHGGSATLFNGGGNLSTEDSILHNDVLRYIGSLHREISNLQFKLSHFEKK